MSQYFAPAVYLLCFLASTVCAVMLGRSFHRTRAGLLFWSALCFLLLVLDLIVFPGSVDLAVPRALLSLAAVATLLFGFIWNGEGE